VQTYDERRAFLSPFAQCDGAKAAIADLLKDLVAFRENVL
jgi:hypothetical protein